MMAEMALLDDEASDASLLDRARAGDRAAFAALVEAHYAFVHRVAYRLVGHKSDAEDVVQEVCARLGHSIRTFRGDAGLESWLYTLILNAVRDMARRTTREAARAAAFAVQARIDGDGVADPDDRADALWRAVRQLPPKQRDAVTLVYGEGLAHSAAAEAMGCTEATVSWHVHEARKRLKAMMAAAREES
jgi:RNA polymerase sigma-70 factor (ECF subfamily)